MKNQIPLQIFEITFAKRSFCGSLYEGMLKQMLNLLVKQLLLRAVHFWKLENLGFNHCLHSAASFILDTATRALICFLRWACNVIYPTLESWASLSPYLFSHIMYSWSGLFVIDVLASIIQFFLSFSFYFSYSRPQQKAKSVCKFQKCYF